MKGTVDLLEMYHPFLTSWPISLHHNPHTVYFVEAHFFRLTILKVTSDRSSHNSGFFLEVWKLLAGEAFQKSRASEQCKHKLLSWCGHVKNKNLEKYPTCFLSNKIVPLWLPLTQMWFLNGKGQRVITTRDRLGCRRTSHLFRKDPRPLSTITFHLQFTS